MRVSFAVMGHESRRTAAEALATTTEATLHMDDGHLGENANGDRAWAAHDPAADWHVVLQDDALPVPGFVDQVHAALTVAPATAVSFYVGTSMPFQTVGPVRYAIDLADRTGAAWLESCSLHWGVGVAMPTQSVTDFLAWAQGCDLPYDERIGAYWRRVQHAPVRYTWPSLVDHADGPTTLEHPDGRPRDLPRRAYRTGGRDDWATAPVRY